MNKLFAAFLICVSFINYAQEAQTNDAKNEFKINAAYLLAGFPEVTYERILSEDTALGVSVAFSLEERYRLDFIAIPYYRVYFGKKIASGFFMEGNAAILSEEPREDYFFDADGELTRNNDSKGNQIGAGLGIAIGAKFMVKKEWLVELYGGLGRNFLNNDIIDIVYPRLGVTVGKRF